MGYLTAGRVAPVPRGEWDPLYDYRRLDMVSWGNSTYIARKSSRGAEPIERTNEYWFLCLSPYLTNMTGATDSKDGSHGLVPQPLMGDQNKFLRGDGTWSEVDLSEFKGADEHFDGKKGTVPKPLAGDQNKFLRGDGTWSSINLAGATGTLPIANGGTGATSVAAARNALGLGNTTGALPIANGGTGATSVAAARNALGLGNTTGALPIANGGTGATSVAAARNALGLGNTTGALPIANGGTGATSVAAARNALGLGNTTGALPIANGGTGATDAMSARNALDVARTDHASTSTRYGLGTSTNYGHVKLSDDYYYSSAANNVKADKGWGASLYALKMVFNLTQKKSYNQIDWISHTSKEYRLNLNGYPYLVICSNGDKSSFKITIIPAKASGYHTIDWADRGYGEPDINHTQNSNFLTVTDHAWGMDIWILSFNSSN